MKKLDNNYKNKKSYKKIEKAITNLVNKGEIKKAIEYCKSLMTNSPSDTNLHIRLGDLYLDWHLDIYQAKQYIDDAITEYQKAAEVLIDNGLIYYKIGLALFYKSDLDKAINYFNIAIDKNYSKSDCEYMIAQALNKKFRYTDALEHLDIAIKSSFLKSSRMHYFKARLLSRLYFTNFNKKMESVKELILSYLLLPFDKLAVKDLFDRIKTLKVLLVILKADAYFSKNRIEEGFKCYSEAIDKTPGYSKLYSALGDAYKKVGNLEAATVEYKMALWLDTLNCYAYSGLVETYEEMGDYESAISYYQKFIQIQPNNAVLHSNLANLYFMKNEPEKAVSHYQAAIALNPKPDWTSIVAQTLGFIQQNFIKNTDCAISNYQIASSLTPKEIDIYISLGSAFYDNEDYKNALIVYRRALELEPNNSKIHCNLGYLHWGMGDLDEAIKEYNLSIKFDSTYDIAHNNLGVIYLDDLVQIQKAIDCFKKAVECNSEYALAYYNLGRCYALKGENVEAAKYFQEALNVNEITNEIDPEDIRERLNNLFN